MKISQLRTAILTDAYEVSAELVAEAIIELINPTILGPDVREDDPPAPPLSS
jgi:hypothetical protein